MLFISFLQLSYCIGDCGTAKVVDLNLNDRFSESKFLGVLIEAR